MRHSVTESVAMRYLVKPIWRGYRPDADGLEEKTVTAVHFFRDFNVAQLDLEKIIMPD
jgi:hypothetical protein